MKAYTRINNKLFEVKNKIVHTNKHYDCLAEAYKRPSYTKFKIWSDWLYWFYTCKDLQENDYIEIASKNSHFFTIQGYIHGHKFKITPKHNYIQIQGLESFNLE